MRSYVTVENHGSLVLLRPSTQVMERWLRANVQDDAQWFGSALVVEPRYVAELLQGIRDAGYGVRP